MLALLSAVVALGCVLASARRLAWAVAPTALDAGLLWGALQGDGGKSRWEALRCAVISAPGRTWERDLFLALGDDDPRSREAQVVEQLLELDWVALRWSRVPRVCASIATSAGFLFGAIALLRGMDVPREDGVSPTDGAVLLSALDALAVGIAGTSFCVAAHLRARRAVRERLACDERLVGRLLALAAESHEP
jgi:hypothetical protein